MEDKTKHLDALDNQAFSAPYSVVNQCVFVESKIKEQIICDQYTPFIAFIDLVLRRAVDLINHFNRNLCDVIITISWEPSDDNLTTVGTV